MERTELDVMMIRVNAMMGSGRYAEARRLLDVVLGAEPSHGVAHGMMGWICWALLDDPERSLVHFRCGVRWAPGYVNAWMHYLNVLATNGSEEELHEAFARALHVPGIDRAAVYAIVANYLERSGRPVLAIEQYRSAVNVSVTVSAETEYRTHIRRLRTRLRRARWAI